MSPEQDDKPPLFASWRGWYVLVSLVLLIQIILYLLITRSFA